MFIQGLFVLVKNWKQLKFPVIGQGLSKLDYLEKEENFIPHKNGIVDYIHMWTYM